MTTAQNLVTEFNKSFGFEIGVNASLHALAKYARIYGRIELADKLDYAANAPADAEIGCKVFV